MKIAREKERARMKLHKGRRMTGRKRAAAALLAACVVLAGTSVVVYAATGNGYDPGDAAEHQGWTSSVTGIQYHSYGKLAYTEGENAVVLDAADLAAIDALVGEGKTKLKQAIRAVDADDRLGTSAWTEGEYPDFEALANRVLISQTLSDAQKGTQAVNAQGEPLYYTDQAANDAQDLSGTGTADSGFPVYCLSASAANLTAGSAAFVDGRLIVGTGADNRAFYEKGYLDGFEKSTNSASIEYTYHQHTGSSSGGGGCYTAGYHVHTDACPKGTCTVYVDCTSTHSDGGSYHNFYTYEHRDCGEGWSAGEDWQNHSRQGSWTQTHEYYICNNSPINRYNLGCGKTTSTIESATIVFR